MKAIINPSLPSGKISAISSKSIAHRMLICAAFADKPSRIVCTDVNDDILATVSCLSVLGASIKYANGIFDVSPSSKKTHTGIFNCNESGSTLRFILPIACAAGGEWDFQLSGRLPYRPISPLKEELICHGISFENSSVGSFRTVGQLTSGDYSIDGGVSSQFISGLLFALSLLEGKSTLTIKGKTESAPYIDMTLETLKIFGADITRQDSTFIIVGKTLSAKENLTVEGDWSNAAFPLALAAISGRSVTLDGLNLNSSQGDKAILKIFESFGAKIHMNEDLITLTGKGLSGITLCAKDIPDLVPIVATVASCAKGETKIFGASRLRMKESDRIKTTCEMLSTLGADIKETDDGLVIKGKPSLSGGTVSSYGDHRIAMSAAVAAMACQNPVIILNAEAVNKSYPDFWRDISSLGVSVKLED